MHLKKRSDMRISQSWDYFRKKIRTLHCWLPEYGYLSFLLKTHMSQKLILFTLWRYMFLIIYLVSKGRRSESIYFIQSHTCFSQLTNALVRDRQHVCRIWPNWSDILKTPTSWYYGKGIGVLVRQSFSHKLPPPPQKVKKINENRHFHVLLFFTNVWNFVWH